METNTPDETLVEKCVSGNDEALSLLIDRYTTLAYNYARRLCGNDEDARDITQNSIIKMWSNIGKYRHEQGSFKTWVWRIIRNTTFDELRKRPRAHFAFSSFDTEIGNALTDNLADDDYLQDELFAQAEDASVLECALQKLAIPARDVLLLRYREDLTFEEIGSTLGEPLNTVKSRHRRALESLRKIIGDTNAHKQ